MWLKVVIVILFVALVVSLLTGFAFLIKDQGTKMRLWNSLAIRVVLVVLLLGCVFYGVFTGQLGSNAPWDARYESKLEPIKATPKP
jgi:nucleoside recognition membrane protein YjiH